MLTKPFTQLSFFLPFFLRPRARELTFKLKITQTLHHGVCVRHVAHYHVVSSVITAVNWSNMFQLLSLLFVSPVVSRNCERSLCTCLAYVVSTEWSFNSAGVCLDCLLLLDNPYDKLKSQCWIITFWLVSYCFLLVLSSTLYPLTPVLCSGDLY